MTLFRKVFPNQSRPATDEEALNEDALRAAFSEMRDAKEPFVLDPFDHAVEEPNEVEATYDDTLDDLDAALEGENNRGATAEMAALSLSDTIDLPEPEEAPDAFAEAEGSVSFVDSDEEIMGSLDDASAGEPETRNMRASDGAMSDVRRPDTTVDDDVARLADAFEEAQAAIEPDEEQQSCCEESDTVAFARAQMAAIGALEIKLDETADSPADKIQTTDLDLPPDTGIDAVPAPAPGRAGRRAARTKTRLLGFHRSEDASSDPFGDTREATATAQREKFPVGWLVVVEGPGVGHSFSIFTGASMIGRGEDQVIRLDFGDNSISRNNHAAVAYDQEQNKFYIGHGGKSNIIRRNARPVLSTEELNHADLIRIGETTLRFVALCGSDFKWQSVEDGNV